MDRAHLSKTKKFTEELEVFLGLGERKLRSAIEYMTWRTRWSGGVSIEFKRDKHMLLLFEINDTGYRPRLRYTSICLKHLAQDRVLTCVAHAPKTKGKSPPVRLEYCKVDRLSLDWVALLSPVRVVADAKVAPIVAS